MALAGALERAGSEEPSPLFVIKGGIALELRLPGRARATRDIDITVNHDSADLVILLEDALATGYGYFSFRRSGEAYPMEHGATRVQVALQYRGQSWGKIPVDLTRREGTHTEIEMVSALALQDPFGITTPDRLPCISLRYQMAQKLHGMTLVRADGRPNERVADVIDLLLLEGSAPPLEKLKTACLDVFARRGQHAWPPRCVVHVGWADRFAQLAEELALDVRNVDDAILRLQRFVNAIDAAPLQ